MSDDSNKKQIANAGRAVGAYLRTLREGKGWTPTEAAALLKTDATQIWRIEKWRSDARSSILFSYIRILQGSADDIAMLFANTDASVDDGIRLAKLRSQMR